MVLRSAGAGDQHLFHSAPCIKGLSKVTDSNKDSVGLRGSLTGTRGAGDICVPSFKSPQPHSLPGCFRDQDCSGFNPAQFHGRVTVSCPRASWSGNVKFIGCSPRDNQRCRAISAGGHPWPMEDRSLWVNAYFFHPPSREVWALPIRLYRKSHGMNLLLSKVGRSTWSWVFAFPTLLCHFSGPVSGPLRSLPI